ncbi:MAG: TIGR01212 family radical SAM protein [Desulfomicrobium sp.]
MFPNRFYPLSLYLKRRFGRRVRKIPLDAGSSCPNRDGTLSRSGCAFCNQQGSGTGLAQTCTSLREQYLALRQRSRDKGQAFFLGYIQSFSNTHGPAQKLRRMLRDLEGLPDLAGIAIGTRPDCLDEEKLEILQDAPFDELWLDLGLQSARDATLRCLNRGHDAACYADWATRAAERGIKVCAHVITGLPGENLADFEQTILFVNSLPVSGIKIHNLYICRDTALARAWNAGTLPLLSLEESLAWHVRGIALLRPEIVVHRLCSDPAPGELLAPSWARDKTAILNALRQRLQKEDIWQGKALGKKMPEWINP